MLSYIKRSSTALAPLRSRLAKPLPMGIVLSLISLLVSIPSLWLASQSYPSLLDVPLFQSYFSNPLIIILNILPPLLLLWGFTLLTDRPWLGYLLMLTLGLGLPVGNYFKISLRGDAVVLSDLYRLNDAARVAGAYTLTIPSAMLILFFFAIFGFCITLLLPHRLHLGWKRRGIATLLSLVIAFGLSTTLYTSQTVYDLTTNEDLIDRWSTSQLYLSRGIWYPFLNSSVEQSLISTVYTGDIESLLSDRDTGDSTGTDTSDTVQQVSVVGIMLEGFTDFTNFEAYAQYEGVQDLYAQWHQLEEESLYGTLVTNIFGGGTVNTEWAFISGQPTHQEFTQPTDSYVWYFREQGYTTQGSHPGYSDFYNRNLVNEYLGFETYHYFEDYYEELGNFYQLCIQSDDLLVDCILSDLTDSLSQGDPVFSFSVSLQNHGPYESAADPDKYITADSGIADETRGWLQTYFDGISTTLDEMTRLRDELEAMDEPVVLVLFGDHLPWMGNGYQGYYEAGISFDTSTEEGFFNYYSVPYIIWANSAAQELTGEVETGYGGDFSPCFLMNRLFQAMDWTQPATMEIASEMMEITPVVHQSGRYYFQGELVDSLPEPYDVQLAEYFALQTYRRETLYEFE